jgi:hypothetical protein
MSRDTQSHRGQRVIDLTTSLLFVRQVSAISGGILQELSQMISNPASIIDLLANSLPSQATYFMQVSESFG